MIIQSDKETHKEIICFMNQRKIEQTKKENDVLVWDEWTIETIVDVFRKIKKEV